MKKIFYIIFYFLFALKISAQTHTFITEGFEGGALPSGWTQTYVNGTQTWVYQTGADYGSISTAHSGTYNAMFVGTGATPKKTTKIYTSVINFTGFTANPTLTFWHGQEVFTSNQDELNVYYKTSAGGSWTLIQSYTTSVASWTQRTITLPNVNSTYYIAFEGVTDYGNGLVIDDISVTGDASSTAPTVSTASVASIGTSSASGGGNITSAGSSAVTVSGICWNTSANPTTALSTKTTNGPTSATSYSGHTMSSLSAETYYYYRAYATNAVGTSYGSDVNFWTLSTEPSGQAASFSASVASSSQINLTFTAASTYGADGYLILRTTGAVAPTNSGVSDATAPASLSFPGGTSLVTTITNSATTTYSSIGLSPSTQYSYAIIPFNWNALNAETYNYKTDGTIATCNGTTLFAPSVEGLQIAGNLVNNGSLIQTDDENYFNMTGSTMSITGAGVYTSTKLLVSGSLTFDGSISSGSFEKTYVDGTKSFTLNNSKTFVNGILTNVGTLTLNASSIFKNSGNYTSTGTMSADATSTVEFNGSAAQTVTSDGDAFGNITINNSVAPSVTDGVILGDAMSLQATSALTLTDGIVICNGKILTVNNSASTGIAAAGGNAAFNQSWVYGNSTSSCLRRYIADNTNTYIFPVGIATRANKAEFINNSLTDGGAFYIDSWFNPSPSNPNTSFASLTEVGATYTSVHTDGVWVLDHSGNINGTYSLKLYFNGAFASLVDNKFSVLSRPTGSSTGAAWTKAGSASNTLVSDGYVYRTGLNSFSEKGVGITDVNLPVELVSFESDCSNDNTILNWVTASETNNSYFAVERSLDMTNFTELDRIIGAGNYNGILNYSYTDFENISLVKYYRIKQVDFDGKIEYFNTITSTCGLKDNSSSEIINAFVNDNNEIQTDIFTSKSVSYSINLYDKLGKLIKNQHIVSSEGANSFNINTSELAAGIYSIAIVGNNKFYTKKLFVR